MSKNIMAILYDFDKTLSTTDMQNYSFIPSLDMSAEEFWGKTTEFSESTGVERILSYMYMMIVEAKKRGIKLTKEYLKSCGKDIKFYPGVSTWFKRINEYAESRGIKVEHYLISSGTKEIVEGSSIVNEFTAIYGCEYYYNEEGEPVWPKMAINYTQKTQFFFRVAKGAIDANDDQGVNSKTKTLRIPMSNIIYMGDGMTDIACMTLVKKNGGNSIAIYQKEYGEKVKQLYNEGRASFTCRADYSANSDLESVVKMIIDRIALQSAIEKKQSTLAQKDTPKK